jgi:hypothetical protein
MIARRLIDRVDAVLKPIGFARRKSIWNRRAGPFIDVIELQGSKPGDAITVSAGVVDIDVFRQCWATEPPALVDSASSTINVRVGQLIDGKDLWWMVTQQDVAEDIRTKVTEFILPFLDRMRSPEAMEQFLNHAKVVNQDYPLPVITLALLKHKNGDQKGACEILTNLGKRTVGAWLGRIGEVVARLGCE